LFDQGVQGAVYSLDLISKTFYLAAQILEPISLVPISTPCWALDAVMKFLFRVKIVNSEDYCSMYIG